MKQDAVMEALHTGLLSLANCDADLTSAADGTQVAEAAPLRWSLFSLLQVCLKSRCVNDTLCTLLLVCILLFRVS